MEEATVGCLHQQRCAEPTKQRGPGIKSVPREEVLLDYACIKVTKGCSRRTCHRALSFMYSASFSLLSALASSSIWSIPRSLSAFCDPSALAQAVQ